MSTARILSLAPLQIAQALIGFGAIAAFTRLMSAEDFGRYALALSISMAAHTLAFTWAEAAAFRFRVEVAPGTMGRMEHDNMPLTPSSSGTSNDKACIAGLPDVPSSCEPRSGAV